MLWTIVQKECLSYLLTFRFLMAFILCHILFVSSAYILTGEFEERFTEYQQAILNDQKELGAVKVYSQLKTPARKPPEVLSIFCEGFDKNPGNTVVVSYDRPPFGAIEEIGAQVTKDFLVEIMLSSLLNIKNFLSAYISIDMVLVVQVVLSLLALIFSYDTISGERERGTLSLMMSNPVKKGIVLVGKYIGGMVSILVPIATSLIFVLLVIEISPNIRFYSAEWSRLGFILLCSLIYISAFFLLGMFISSCTSKSATALMIVLFLWVALVILLPNVGGYVARRVRPVENMERIDAAIKSLDEEYNNELGKYALKHKEPESYYIINIGSTGGGGLPFIYDYLQSGSRDVVLWYLDGTKFMVSLQMRYADRKQQLYEKYYSDLRAQASLAQTISRLSPAWNLYHAASVLANTDIDTHTRFYQQAKIYRDELILYIRSCKGFSSLAFFSQMKEEQLQSFSEWIDEVDKLQKSTQTGNTIEVSVIKHIGGSNFYTRIKAPKGSSKWDWDAVEPLDLSDMPKFTFGRETITKEVHRMMPDVVILVLLNALFFMGAYTAFVKREVK